MVMHPIFMESMVKMEKLVKVEEMFTFLLIILKTKSFLKYNPMEEMEARDKTVVMGKMVLMEKMAKMAIQMKMNGLPVLYSLMI